MSVTTMRIMAAGILLVFSAGAAMAQTKGIEEEDMGLRKEGIYQEETVQPKGGEYSKEAPGKSKRIQRSFDNSPPLIPHDLTGMLPIAETNNICLGCHMPDTAKAMGAIPIPKSHFVDFETHEDLKGKLDGKRYNCMQCHVPQADTAPPVGNVFKGGFRDKKGKSRSNLIDTLNEGVDGE
ncbi:MAG: nitrate reductase cytochrome c-type subunit [Thermodesulfovibrionales bacterium]|jgi:cytochrome c-type protein NapB